jgi:hypothetical protein
LVEHSITPTGVGTNQRHAAPVRGAHTYRLFGASDFDRALEPLLITNETRTAEVLRVLTPRLFRKEEE